MIEQEQIADFLDHKTRQLDNLIAEKQQLINKLEQKKTALIVTSVLKGLSHPASEKNSGVSWLGDIPSHWDVCHLKLISDISYGVGGEIDKSLTEGVKLLSLPNVKKEGILQLDEVPYTVLDEAEKKALLLKKGDLLFNWRNGSSDHLGKTVFFNEDREYTHVSFLLRLRFDPQTANSKYFHYLLTGLRITGFFSSSKAGVNNTFNLSELENLWVINPPVAEQQAIADFLDREIHPIHTMTNGVCSAIQRLKEYRTALITAAVTGKIDVRNIKLENVDS